MQKLGIKIKWLAVSCFEIQCGKTTVVTDPFVTECVGTELDYNAIDKCDIICLSHAHFDHVTDIPRLAKKFNNPKILCGEQTMYPLARWLNYNPALMYPMYPDTELDFNDVKIRALYGRHANQAHATEKAGINDFEEYLLNFNDICKQDGIRDLHIVGSLEYRNYLFTLPNGVKILFFGNDALPELENICKQCKPDVAIIQRSVEPNLVRGKAKFAKEIGCKVFIPHHHDFTKVDLPYVCENMKKAFLEEVPDGVFVTPKHGEWIEL